ncbi:hypothetical protein B0H13DRAFT_1853435 [Mycena leptocephala]|nr:hypothetical protein B0H13DRAFT_1853435 [Mycena leptocephala]
MTAADLAEEYARGHPTVTSWNYKWFFVKNPVQYELNMQRRQHRPPGRNITLKIYKGSLENWEDSHGQDLLQVSVVGNIDKNETSGVEEHHLQAALATSTVRIPIPGSIQLVENYAELYPSNRWMDTETYLQSVQTISEACSAALFDHDYTYFMDETDKTWLDNTNYQCHVEEQIARETPSAETDEIFIRVSISEDEVELVMGLFEILTRPKSEENDHVNAAYVCSCNIPIRRTRAQHLKVGKGKVGRLQSDSSAQHLASERRAGKEPSCATPDYETKVPVGSGVLETATQNGTLNAQTSIKYKVSGARGMISHTHSHSLTATEQTVGPGLDSPGGRPNIPRPVVQSEKVISQDLPLNREGTSTGKTRLTPATRVSGSQQIPSPPKKSSEDGMADSLTGDEARPLLVRNPAQTTDTKTSRQLHDHGPARDENNSFTINFFTGRFAFPPTLLECVQGPSRADGTNSTSVIIDPETKHIDMAQKRTSHAATARVEPTRMGTPSDRAEHGFVLVVTIRYDPWVYLITMFQP